MATTSTPPPQQRHQRTSTTRAARRNYQACLACKGQKVRCQLGSPDDPQPPCARCRRSRLDCVFGPPRGAVQRGPKRPRKQRAAAAELVVAGAEAEGDDPGPSDAAAPLVGVRAGGPSNGSGAGAVPDERGGGRPASGHVGQPRAGPASTAAAAATGNTSGTATVRGGPSPWDAAAVEGALRSRDLSAWAPFPLCRDGWVSPQEAEFLVQCYFERMQPLFPVVDETYQHADRRHALVANEPVLCTAILTVASRYAWFEGTPASSRAHEMHSLLYKQVQQSIYQSLWGVDTDAGRESRILSIIESIVLFVEWRPRPMDIMPNQGMVPGTAYMFGVDPGDPGTAQHPIIDDETTTAYMLVRRVNATSWRLLGHAANLADEISLVEGLSRSREPQPRAPANVQRRARIRDLLIPLTWEVSFRLGRSSFLKLPAPSASTADEYAGGSAFAALLSSRAELYRLCRLIENTLYASVSATKDIIATDRHPEMVASLAEILTDWWNKFQHVSGPFALRKTLEIQYSNVWTYLHAIFFQAIIERLRGAASTATAAAATATAPREPSIQHFERAYRPQSLSIAEVLRSERSRRDLHMAEEIAKASVQVLERALEIEQEGYLRFLPFTTMTWVFTSATLLLKGSGLRPDAVDAGTKELLKRVAHAVDRAVVDDVHAMSHHTSSLLMLIQKVEQQTGAAATASRTGRPQDTTAGRGGAVPAASASSQPIPGDLPPMDIGASSSSTDAAALEASGGLFDPMFANGLLMGDDWANWLSVGLQDMDGGFGFDLYPGSSSGAGEFPPGAAGWN